MGSRSDLAYSRQSARSRRKWHLTAIEHREMQRHARACRPDKHKVSKRSASNTYICLILGAFIGWNWGNVHAGGHCMATPQIEAVIERLAGDKAFRVKYCHNPDETLEAYHLTPDEIRYIKTGDD